MISEILNSYSYTLDYLRRLIDDLPDDALAAQPNGVVNHPLWTIGHLTFAAQMIGSDLGLSAWLPDDWQQRYGTASVPVADRAAYPGKQTLLDRLRDAENRLAARLKALGEDGLQQQFPDVRYRELFPTLGHAVSHVLMAHTASHIGQTVVWRRVMGFEPLAKVYD